MVSTTRRFLPSRNHSLEFLVSHDMRTMPRALASMIASGSTSAGVLLVIPQNALIREVVEALIRIWVDDRADDWRNLLAKIPF
jgi:hypothetical protein